MPDQELKHHGVIGMKWGVRRYQNPDGSLTAAGRRQYDVGKPKRSTSKSKSASSKLKRAYKDHQKLSAKKKKIREKAKKDAAKLKQKEQLAEYKKEQEEKYKKRANLEKPNPAKTEVTTDKTKDLSNEELRKVIERIELEKRYNDLTKPSEIQTRHKGREFLKKQLGSIATNAIQSVSKVMIDEYLVKGTRNYIQSSREEKQKQKNSK